MPQYCLPVLKTQRQPRNANEEMFRLFISTIVFIAISTEFEEK
jgi:hypothetical protein